MDTVVTMSDRNCTLLKMYGAGPLGRQALQTGYPAYRSLKQPVR